MSGWLKVLLTTLMTLPNSQGELCGTYVLAPGLTYSLEILS